MRIEVSDVSVNRNKVVFKLDYSKSLRKYLLRDTFFVEYDDKVDIGDVDESILAIPIVSAVAPVAWAVGADIYVDRLDETFLHSLARIKKVLGDFYPNFSLASDTVIRSVVSNRIGGSRTGLLFSGGLDCITTYARHRDKRPDLISVRGCEIRLHEQAAWNEAMAGIQSFANRENVVALQVRTDGNYINTLLLGYEFGVGWYSKVSHGLIHLGLCAPITAAREMSCILIGSSHTKEIKEPWGSHPSIDSNVSWADVTVVHDGYDLSRQQKAKYVLSIDPDYLSHLRVCYKVPETNCMKCEKCFRTASELIVAGADPRACKFNVDKKAFARMKDSLAKGRISGLECITFMWTDIQRHIPEDIPNGISGSREFLAWLKEFDLSRRKISRLRHFLWDVDLRLLRISQMLRKPRQIGGTMQFLKWAAVCFLYLISARIGRFTESYHQRHCGRTRELD